MSFSFSRNALGRLILVSPDTGIATIDVVEVADPITGTPITVLDSALLAITFPLALTQTPGNALSWYSQEMIFPTAGEYIIEFDPDVGNNFTDTLTVSSLGTVPAPSLQLCALEDHVVDAQGQPLENITVAARILAPPYVVSGAAVSTDVVTTTTNSDGFFSISMLRSATVDIMIPELTYRRTIVVPNQAQADLFSIAAS